MHPSIRLIFAAQLVVGATLLRPTIATGQTDSIPVLARREGGQVYVWKDPRHARTLSWFWPGWGNIYAGDPITGYTFATLDVGVALVGISGIMAASDCEVYDCRRGRAWVFASLGTDLLLSAVSASMAGHYVDWYNREHRLGAIIRRVRPVVASADGRVLVGLSAP